MSFHTSSLCFCSTFTSRRSHRTLSSAATLCPHQPASAKPYPRRSHATPPRRAPRDTPVAATDAGSVPDFGDDDIQLQYFSPDTPPSVTPDTASPPTPADPPDAYELPLFPLQLVLNPGTQVPLHIFEMRYRILFNRIRDTKSRFGIVLSESKTSSLALVGCSAELTRFESLPDGRIHTNNLGKDRFRILRIVDDKPYTRAIVQPHFDDAPRDNLLPLVNELWQTLQDVLRLSNKLYDRKWALSSDLKNLAPADDGSLGGLSPVDGEDTPEGWPSLRAMEKFSFAVSEVMDVPINEQQGLLQITDTARRLQRQNRMLQSARQYLAAQSSIKEADLKGF